MRQLISTPCGSEDKEMRFFMIWESGSVFMIERVKNSHSIKSPRFLLVPGDISSYLNLCKFALGWSGDSSSINLPSSINLRRDKSPRQAIY